MCDAIFEESDLWVQTEHTAREEHRCSECQLLISPGIRYVRTFAAHEGSVDLFCTHLECLDLVKYVSFVVCDQDYYGLTMQPLRDRVAEHLEDPGVVSRYRKHVRARMADGTWRPRAS